MAIKREDYPNIDDDTWALLSADVDRERTAASQTASETGRKKALKEAEAERDAIIEAKLAEKVAAEKMTAEEKLNAELNKLKDKERQITMKERTLVVKEKLTTSNVPVNDKIVSLLAGAPDDSFEDTVASYIDNYTATVSSQVDKVKQELMANITPPTAGAEGAPDKQTVFKANMASGNVAGAIDVLLAK